MKRFLSFLGQATILLFGLFLLSWIFPDSYGEIMKAILVFYFQNSLVLCILQIIKRVFMRSCPY